MRLAVASGKGGTGKTTVAVSMALSLEAAEPLYIDCDVEEPNAALFLRPTLAERREVGQYIPEVNADLCVHCGRCAEVCRFHAIAVIGQDVLVFPELCHGCGSCTRNCPTGAISEILHVMGALERGPAGPITFAQGILNVGEAMAVPVIRQLKRWAGTDDEGTAPTGLSEGGSRDGSDGGGDVRGSSVGPGRPGSRPGRAGGRPGRAGGRPVILDAPPGTSCPVVETLRGADAVLLVTEPTPFGLHDLRIAVQVARDELELPVAVIINRDGVGDAEVEAFCAAEDIPILLRIPLRRDIAEGIAAGQALVEIDPAYRSRFVEVYHAMEALAQHPVSRAALLTTEPGAPKGGLL